MGGIPTVLRGVKTVEDSHYTVADNAHIRSRGTWTGTVQVGGTTTRCTFEVFDCNNAFDIILGKPWLKAVKAIHYYEQDEIVIGQNGEQELLVNEAKEEEEAEQDEKSEGEGAAQETDPEQQLRQEEVRITLVRAHEGKWKETRWAKYLEVDEMEDTPEGKTILGVEWYTTRQEQAEIKEKKQREEQEKERNEKWRRDAEEEELLATTRQAARDGGTRRENPTKSYKERREEHDKRATERW
jgi:hypothetical protein